MLDKIGMAIKKAPIRSLNLFVGMNVLAFGLNGIKL